MESTKKKYYNEAILLYIFGMIIYHFLMNMNIQDDSYFANIIADGNMTLLDFLKMRWSQWSSRVVIEALLVPLSMISPIVWRVLDILFWIWLGYILLRLFNIEIKSNESKVLVILLLQYPIIHMASAGWIATSLNYLWPLTAGLWIILLTRDELYGNSKGLCKYIFSIPIALLACNQEQMSAILTVILTIAVVWGIAQRKKIYKIIPFWLISVISLIVIMLCPGNANRNVQEVLNWMPDFMSFSLMHKLYNGYSNMMNHFITVPNVIIAIFIVSVVYLYVKKQHSLVHKSIGLFPLIYYVINCLYANDSRVYVFVFKLPEYDELNNKSGVFNLMVSILFLVVLLYEVLSIFEQIEDKVIIVLLLGAGFASSIVMGFSPTIYASCERVFIFQYFSFIMAELFILKKKKVVVPDELIIGGLGVSFVQVTINCVMIRGFI